jgi:hypothetical protein
MIQVPTTFVIGAGGSAGQGYPLGPALFAAIRDFGEEDLAFLTQIVGIGTAELIPFLHGVRDYPGVSIDALLRNQPSMRVLGHAAIALSLGRFELVPHPYRHAPSAWLQKILTAMAKDTDSPSAFAEKNRHVNFVTFNFDTLIERTAGPFVSKFFSKNAPVSADRSLVNVVHLHGMLPPNCQLNVDTWIRPAAEAIKVIHDELDQPKVLEAQLAIANSTVVCFLGFDYEGQNLQTLNIARGLKRGQQEVFGSAYGLGAGKRDAVQRLFGRQISLAGEKADCASTLAVFDVLRT